MSRCTPNPTNERGVALLTVLMLLIFMTTLAIAAMTVTGLENKVAGYSLTTEAAAAAAESCLGTGANILSQVIDQGEVPAAFIPTPVPTAVSVGLAGEVLGQFDNDGDSVAGSAASGPDLAFTVGNFSVRGDIDRMYKKAKSGGSLQFAAGAEGKGTANEVSVFYRIDCVAQNTTTGTRSPVAAVYECLASGDGCQRRPY